MRNLLRIISLSLLFVFSLNIIAQENNTDSETKRKWREEFKLKKQEFITNKLDLTPSQADAFFPLYWELQTKKYEIQKENKVKFHKMMDSSADYTDKEYADMALKLSESKVKEEELNVVYMKKFMNVIPGKALLKLPFTELDFNKSMMRESHRNSKNNQGKEAHHTKSHKSECPLGNL